MRSGFCTGEHTLHDLAWEHTESEAGSEALMIWYISHVNHWRIIVHKLSPGHGMTPCVIGRTRTVNCPALQMVC